MAVKAFPTAYGAGAYVTGGRGKPVYHVTNLNNSGSGSLRNGLITGNKTIVFDVSGVIMLNTPLQVSNISNITIAFQTAPRGGITIDGDVVLFQSVTNLIVRYARFKGGIKSRSTDGGPTNSYQSKHNVVDQIFDHCTFAFGFFQGGSWYEVSNGYNMDRFTVQRCFFAENNKGALSGGQSGTNVTVGSYSFIKNLFYNQTHRVPNVAGDGARIDVINNVTWNALWRLMQPAGSLLLNHIGNYYHYNLTRIDDTRLQMYGSKVSQLPSIYTKNNKYIAPSGGGGMVSSIAQINSNNKLAFKRFYTPTGQQLPENHFTNTQHLLNGEPIQILTAEQAFEDVKNDVGCNARLNEDGSVSDNKDVLDSSWLQKIKDGIFDPQRTNTNHWIVPPITSISRPSNFYGPNPHIPAVWFNDNVPSGKNHNSIAPDGRTYLENYLNQVDVLEEDPGPQISIPVITRTDSNPTTITKGGNYIPPTGIWTDEIDGSGTATIGGDTVNVNILGNYTVTLYHTNSSNKTSRISIVYKVIAPTDPEPGDNINYPLTNAERKRGKQAIIQMIKQKTI